MTSMLFACAAGQCDHAASAACGAVLVPRVDCVVLVGEFVAQAFVAAGEYQSVGVMSQMRR